MDRTRVKLVKPHPHWAWYVVITVLAAVTTFLTGMALYSGPLK